MDQLVSAFGIDWRLLLIQAVNFGLLLAVLWYFLYRPVLSMIDKRRERIAQGIRAAEEADHRLSIARTEGQGIVASATRDAEQIILEARERAESKGADLVKGAQSRAENIMAEAFARTEEMHRESVRKSEKEIARAALLAAEKILREKHS